MRRTPPRLALALLNRAIPGGAREEIEGDLIEEFERHRRTRLWFWMQAASISWSYLPRWSMPRASVPTLFHDARSGARSLRRRPAFALAAGTLLALGIGVNAAMFQWIDALWNRSLPYAEADRLVRVFHSRQGSRESLSPPNYFDLTGEGGLRASRRILEPEPDAHRRRGAGEAPCSDRIPRLLRSPGDRAPRGAKLHTRG